MNFIKIRLPPDENRTRIEVRLNKLGICKCGFTLLHDDIKLGTKYFVNPMLLQTGAKMSCGGCRKVIPFGDAIYTYHRDGSGGHFLPIAIFNIKTDALPTDSPTAQKRRSQRRQTTQNRRPRSAKPRAA